MTARLDSLTDVLALRFNLDQYSNFWASPKAALIFWVCFLVVVVLVAGLTMWMFRRMRPH